MTETSVEHLQLPLEVATSFVEFIELTLSRVTLSCERSSLVLTLALTQPFRDMSKSTAMLIKFIVETLHFQKRMLAHRTGDASATLMTTQDL